MARTSLQSGGVVSSERIAVLHKDFVIPKKDVEKVILSKKTKGLLESLNKDG